MKIALIVTLFPPERMGGVELSAYNIAQLLADRGHEVHVITSLDKGLPLESHENGFYVHRIFWRRLKTAGYFSFWAKIILNLRKINPDIVHVHGMWIGISGYLANKLLKIPYVLHCQGSDVYRPQLPIKLTSKMVFKNAAAVIALTEHMKVEIQNVYNRDVFVIPNGIDLKKFEDFTKNRIHNNEGRKKILFVGRLHTVKGVKYLIESMKIIKIDFPNIELILVGDGEEKCKLESLVKQFNLSEYVSFVGIVPNQQIPKCMIESDIFVLPSLSEGFGIVILEAMASGLPIVASNVGGIPYLVQNEINGFLVEPKNPDQIAEKVLHLLKNDKLMQDISDNNRKFVTKYEWKEIVLSLEKVYNTSIKLTRK
jgi:glycosyltransferase involved in cell wall biosynthesis